MRVGGNAEHTIASAPGRIPTLGVTVEIHVEREFQSRQAPWYEPN